MDRYCGSVSSGEVERLKAQKGVHWGWVNDTGGVKADGRLCVILLI